MVGLDSLGLVGPRNLHPEQVFWELHEGGWDHPEKPYGRPPSAPPADLGLLTSLCQRQEMLAVMWAPLSSLQ